MQFKTALVALLALPLLALSASEVQIEYTVTNECTRKTQRGDSISVHYKGTLASDGSKFDASYDRGQPLDFTVGQGQVIKGWDDNLLDMCPGDKRKLTIPPEFGYGDRAMGPIPAGSTLGECIHCLVGPLAFRMRVSEKGMTDMLVVFDTELMDIKGVSKDEL